MIQIANWETFQHYKDREPKWIKLHRSLLHNPQWGRLDGDAAKLLVELWMLAAASGSDGKIDMTLDELAWTLRRDAANVEKWVKSLADNDFVVVCTELYRTVQNCTDLYTEKRREEKRREETEGEREREKKRNPPVVPPTQGQGGPDGSLYSLALDGLGRGELDERQKGWAQQDVDALVAKHGPAVAEELLRGLIWLRDHGEAGLAPDEAYTPGMLTGKPWGLLDDDGKRTGQVLLGRGTDRERQCHIIEACRQAYRETQPTGIRSGGGLSRLGVA